MSERTPESPAESHAAEIFIPEEYRGQIFLSPKETAKLWDCSVPTVYRAIYGGNVKGYKFGRATKLRVDDVCRYAASLPVIENREAA